MMGYNALGGTLPRRLPLLGPHRRPRLTAAV